MRVFPAFKTPRPRRERPGSPAASVLRSGNPQAPRGEPVGEGAADDPRRPARAPARSPGPPALPEAAGQSPARRPRGPPPALPGGPTDAPEGARPRPRAGGARRGEGARPHPAPAPGASPRSPRPGWRRPAQPLARAARRDELPPPLPPRPPLGPRPPGPGARGAKVTAPAGWAWTPAGGPGTLLGARGLGRGGGGRPACRRRPRCQLEGPAAGRSSGAGSLQVWALFCTVPGERRGAETWDG